MTDEQREELAAAVREQGKLQSAIDDLNRQYNMVLGRILALLPRHEEPAAVIDDPPTVTTTSRPNLGRDGVLKMAWTKDVGRYKGWCFCGNCQTRGPESSWHADITSAIEEAFQLWEALLRTSAESPEKNADEPIGATRSSESNPPRVGPATMRIMEAMRDAIADWPERDYLCFNHEHGMGECVDRSDVVDALRECGLEDTQ